jgi:hypothetical protein
MKNFLTFLMVMLVAVLLISTATSAGIQKPVVKNAVIADEGVQPDRPQVAEDHSYTVYPAAKKKGTPWTTDKTVGYGGDYETFKDALIDLYANGIDANVSLVVLGSYDAMTYGETFPITFRSTFYNLGGYTLTVKPAPGATATITNTAAVSGSQALVVLDSMRNMVWDGNNGTSDYALSIVWNGGRTATGRTVNLWNSCRDIAFSNMVFKTSCGGSSPNFRNVDVSGKQTVDGYIQNVEFNNCKFLDNGTDGPEYHLYISGYAAAPVGVPATNLTSNVNVRHCIFKNANGLGSYWGAGIQVRYGVSDCVFEYNDFTYDQVAPMNGGSSGIFVGGSSDAIKNITIRNNNVHDMVTSVAATLCAGIGVQGPTATTVGCFSPANIVIDNNTISNIYSAGGMAGTYSMNGMWGIRASGSVNGLQISNNQISNLGYPDGVAGYQPMGISVSFTNTSVYKPANVQIVGNTIDGIHAGGAVSANTMALGMRIGAGDSIYVLKNKIKTIDATSLKKFLVGIGAWGSNGKAWYQQYANNFISIPTASAVREDIMVDGIQDYAYAGNINEYLYNSVYIGGTSLGGEISAGFMSHASPSTRILTNNVFFNARTNPGTGANVALGCVYDSAVTTWFTDYNDYYAPDIASGAIAWIGSGWATDIPQLQALMQAGQDVHSVSGEPTYINAAANDLHQKIGTFSVCDNTATPLAITDDIDGDLRGVGKLAPDIGADEFEAGAPGAFAMLTPTNTETGVPINGTLTWEASANAYSYDVYLGETMPGTPTATVTGLSYPYAGLSGNTDYTWKVVAKNDIGPQDATITPFTFKTGALPPAAPTDLAFSNYAVDGVDVSWTDNSTDETGFKVYTRLTTEDPWDLQATVLADGDEGDVETATVSGLDASITYLVKVVAYHAVQGESDGLLGSFTTLAKVPGAPAALTITKRGMNLKAGTDDNGDATEYAFQDAVTGKWVQAVTIPGAYPVTYFELGTTPVWQTRSAWGAFTGTRVGDLLPSTLYQWKAKARNADAVESDFSATTGDYSTTAPATVSPTPVTEGFEATTFPPTDWGRVDALADGTGDPDPAYVDFYGIWARVSTRAFRGGGCARYLYEYTGTNGADDWLITLPMSFETGKNYIVSYYVRTVGGNPEALAVTLGKGPTPADQTTTLRDDVDLTNADYAFKAKVFSVSETGTYYIGFHAHTPTNEYYIRLDEVKVAEANSTDIAGLTLVQSNGTRPMTKVTNKKDVLKEAVPFEHTPRTGGNRPSDINNTRLVTGVKTPYQLQTFAGEAQAIDAFVSNNGILKATPQPLNMNAQFANIGVSDIPGFTVDYTVDDVAQPTATGGAITAGTDAVLPLPWTAAQRGQFNAVAGASVVGEADRSNDTLRASLLVYPVPSYNLRYDTYGANTYVWGANNPYADARTSIGMRITNTVRGRVAQIDLYTESNRRYGTTWSNVLYPEVWTFTVRGAGVDDNTPGAILYTKQFSGPKYNTLTGSLKTFALGDDAPVIDAGQNFWITATAESAAVTTGALPFGLYGFLDDGAMLLPGAQGRSYASDYVTEEWYAMDEAVFGPGSGDWGSWPMRTIMVPVSNSISGVVFEDKDGNGTQELPADAGIEGVEVKLVGNLDITTTTNSLGQYQFNDLETGTFTVKQTVPTGFVCSVPGASAEYSVTLGTSESVAKDFADFKTTSVGGVVWRDLNHNGAVDVGEPGMVGIHVLLNATDKVTGVDGSYLFEGVTGGAYTLAAVPPSGKYQTYPTSPVAFSVTSGMDPIVQNFGLNAADDTLKFRTFKQEDIVTLVKDKVPAAIAKKSDKVEFEVELTDTLTAKKKDLHVEFGYKVLAAPYAHVVKKNGTVLTSPADYVISTTGGIDGINKKLDYVFTDSLVKGDKITIHAFALLSNNKILPKIKFNWTPKSAKNPKDLVYTVPAAGLAGVGTFTQNQPRLRMPYYNNLWNELFASAGWFAKNMTPTDSLVIGIAKKDSAKVWGWVWQNKPSTVAQSLYDKTLKTHDGDAKFFTYFDGSTPPKVFKGQLAYLSPKKQDNKLFAEILALKLGIAASKFTHTPLGLGELVYSDTTSAYSHFNNKPLKDIATEASRSMTLKTSTWGTPAQFYYVLRRINEAFAGTMDTTAFAAKMVMPGVKAVKDVAFIIADPSIPKEVGKPVFDYQDVPSIFELAQNYPNPFNPSTTIEFILPEDAIVTLKVYNVLGQEVSVLADNELYTAGQNIFTFDGSRLASGVYFYRLTAESVGEDAVGKFTQVKKMLLMK